MSDYLFPCRQCGKHRFLYIGVCRECAPDLHAEYEQANAVWDRRFAEYVAATGIEPLSDWLRFEDWCRERGWAEESHA